jgi:hypothetical protein
MDFSHRLGWQTIRESLIHPSTPDSNPYRICSRDGKLLNGRDEVATPCWLSVVAKPHLPGMRYDIANDVIGSEILRYLGLPVPPFAVAAPVGEGPGELCFASVNFNFNSKYGKDLLPVDPQRCAEELPDETTGVILGDIFIKNRDRPCHNVFVDFQRNPRRMFIYDQKECLSGMSIGLTPEELTEQAAEFGIGNHCFLDRLSTDRYFEKWIHRIKSIPNWWLEDLVKKASQHIDNAKEDELGAIYEFLLYRRDHFISIVQKNRQLFTRIEDWNLSWAPGLRVQKRTI